jgi:hypothetical protein
MEPVIVIAGMGLVLALAVVVGYPFFARTQPHASGIGRRGRQLREHREQLYASLKELEFDRELGKLAPADYVRLRRPLEEEALRVIQELDELNGHSQGEGLRQRIEEEVLARRRRPPQAAQHCAHCGASRRAEDRFCSQCGSELEERSN